MAGVAMGFLLEPPGNGDPGHRDAVVVSEFLDAAVYRLVAAGMGVAWRP